MMLRWLAALLCLLLILPGLTAAQDDPANDPDTPVSQPADDAESTQQEERASVGAPALPLASIPLQENLRFTVRPTILGLIPPDSAEDYGEGLIRVSQRQGRQLTLHYEIKEEIEKERGGAETFELQEAPAEMRTEFLTRFRRGDAVVEDFSSGRRIASPLFWEDGDFRARDYGLLWVEYGLLAELKENGSAAWDLHCTTSAESERAAELNDLMDSRRRAQGLADGAEPRLELLEAQGRYIVPVNGEMSQLAAVHARDSFGVAEYWFLDDPDNPLLLKMSFIASPDASPNQAGILRQLLAGVGFAVTSINY
ncbi:MAG: hypothetical protein R3F46_00595 [bacterium]